MDIKYQVVFTEKAKHQINDIYEYISVNLFDDNAAKNLMAKIESKLKYLAAFPMMHPVSKVKFYRKCIIDNYIAFYKVDEVHKTVVIMAVYHGSQDYESYF